MRNLIRKLGILLIMLVMINTLFSCQETSAIYYYDENAPAPILIDGNSVSVENLAGKSVLSYDVPNDENLLYVKAVYESAPGVIRQAHSSRFVDTLAIEGFAQSGEYAVKLYTVGKNEKESGPLILTVTPLSPPLEDAFPSLNMIATFGGIEGTFTNLHKAAIKAVLMGDTANTGVPEFLQSFVIDNPEAKFTIRGLPSKTMDFYVYLMDRWGNKTETKEYKLYPLFEEVLDKKLWKEHKLPSDFQNSTENNYWGYVFKGMFNGEVSPKGSWSGNFIPETKPWPSYFTIDLGVTAILSRLNMVPWWSWHMPWMPRDFEVYGTTASNPGDDLDGSEWALLGEFHTWKPSGDDPTIITAEDRNHVWPDGANYDVLPSERQPDPYFPVRILRFKILRAFAEGDGYSIDELTVWGQIIE